MDVVGRFELVGAERRGPVTGVRTVREERRRERSEPDRRRDRNDEGPVGDELGGNGREIAAEAEPDDPDRRGAARSQPRQDALQIVHRLADGLVQASDVPRREQLARIPGGRRRTRANRGRQVRRVWCPTSDGSGRHRATAPPAGVIFETPMQLLKQGLKVLLNNAVILRVAGKLSV